MTDSVVPMMLVKRAIICSLFVLSLCSVSLAQAEKLKPVTVQLKWKHQFQFAGYYAAKAKGFYSGAGFDVTLKEAGPGINPIDEVLSGNAEYGVANSELLLYRMNGEPVTALAVIFQHSPLVLISLRETGILSPQDLVGKKVMFPEGHYGANTLGILLREGVDRSKIEQIPLSFNIEDLISKKVDAMVGYLTDKPYILEKRGIKYNIIEPRIYGIDFYGDTLFTSEQRSDNSFEEVRKFREATLQGWRYAMNHQNEIIDLIINEYQSERSREELMYEATASAKLIMPGLVDLGHMNPGRWEHIADTFRSLNMASGGYDEEAFIFNEDKRALANDFEVVWKTFFFVLLGTFIFILGLIVFNNRLQKRVKEQTAHLEEANQFLVNQTNELIAIENKLSDLNADLEKRVAERTAELYTANEELKNEVEIRRERELTLELLSSALENSRSLVVIVDRRGVLKYINNAFRDFTGQLPGSLEGCQLSDLEPYFRFPDVDDDEFLSFVKTQQKLELCGYDSGRNSHWFQVTVSPIFSDDKVPTHYVIVCEDITRMKQRQDEMERLAFYDPLTGLENRVLFKHNLNRVLDQAKREQNRSALLFVDLDHFKEVNDNYGHETGDIVLKTIATRIRNQVRESDSVARISGDEFAVLLVNINTSEDAVRIASYILQECVKPVKYKNHSHTVSASIGISVTPDDAITCDDLIRCADLAMYKAKRQGRDNYHFYSSETQNITKHRNTLEADIRDSISDKQFKLEYQPQVCLKSRKVKAVEALVRWQREDGAVSLPEDFLEVAENSGLILSMGEWMVNEIERTRARLHEAGLNSVKVSVNLSPSQFHDERFIALLTQVAKNHHGEVSDVQIEVKEKALFENAEESLVKLEQLKQLGYSISIDDFGTGYLSLSYLRRFPVDVIKIDKSLINRLPTDQEAVEITLALIAMAHKLNIEVVAEGVESEEQMRFLKNNGCDMAQGFYFSHAVSLKDFISTQPMLH